VDLIGVHLHTQMVAAKVNAQMELNLTGMAEAIIYDYDPRDRQSDLEIVDRPDLLMWTRPGPTKWFSSVRIARWNAAQADDRIQEALAFFRERHRPFVWHVSPSSAPADLGVRLERAGLVLEQKTRLLVAELPVQGLRVNDHVRIVDTRTSDEVEARLRFAWPAWTDEEIQSETKERMRSLELYGERAGFLLAYLGDAAVADASWRDSTDGRTVYLIGAGTRDEHRGKGIYQTLTAYRLDHALARGCRYAIIQARMDTSMPILLRRGFRDVGETSVFSWAPT
jgi:GNAT superfamily N-acetyltransferase